MFVGDVLLQIMVAGTGSCTIQGTEDEEGKKNLLVLVQEFSDHSKNIFLTRNIRAMIVGMGST